MLQSLLLRRNEFKRFLAARLGNEADAEDLLQTGLVRALQTDHGPQDTEKLTSWFYQVLRNVLIDHARSRKSAVHREAQWQELSVSAVPEAERELCQCFEALLPSLNPTQAALIRRCELGGESVAQVSAELGLSPGNGRIMLHRARLQLRAKLALLCGNCAEAACLDCDCENDSAARPL
jgi:RNA polymerase sigma-70 factor, ECF subfamily